MQKFETAILTLVFGFFGLWTALQSLAFGPLILSYLSGAICGAVFYGLARVLYYSTLVVGLLVRASRFEPQRR